MKILKYEKNEKDTEIPVRLALRKLEDGILVHVVNAKGEHIKDGNLVKFKDNGRIEKQTEVNNKLGFQLDDRGRIKEETL